MNRLKKKHLGNLLGGDYTSASAINEVGEVAGASNTGEAILPFIWTPTGKLQRVPLLPGDNCGQANGINKHGHVVGYSSGPNGAKAFLWTRGKGVHNLGVLPGGNYSRACDINDLDEVAGTSASAAGDRAVLWTKLALCAILGRCREIRRARLPRLTTMGMSSGTRKVRGECARFCGLQQLECRIWGCSRVETPAELLVSTTRVLWLGVRQARREIALLWTQQAGMRDLNSAASVTLGVVFVEAQAIDSTVRSLLWGATHHSTGVATPLGNARQPLHQRFCSHDSGEMISGAIGIVHVITPSRPVRDQLRSRRLSTCGRA